jgi:membrane protein
MTIRLALPGSLFAATAWTVSGLALRVYASASTSVQLYGVVGAFLLLLSWLYVGGFVLMVGVVLNAVRGGHVDPDERWVPGDDSANAE